MKHTVDSSIRTGTVPSKDSVINVFQPDLGERELAAVREVFDSNWIGKGSKTELFESRFAAYLNIERTAVVSVSSCTEGLFQILDYLGYEPGDEIILPSISFVGAANAVAGQGLSPVFCDVDPRTLNVTPEAILEKITPKTRAVLLLHYGGHPCDMDGIMSVAREKGLVVIEDNACSLGSLYGTRACGTLADFGVWSFDAMKTLVTGDGGMIFCRDPEDAQKLRKQMYLGLESPSGFSGTDKDRWWEFRISSFGRRSIMNDIASAIGCVQLERLEGFLQTRRAIASRYTEAFKDIPQIQTPPELRCEGQVSNYLYWIQVKDGQRDDLARSLKEKDIYTTFRYYPLHRVKAYGCTDTFPQADLAADSTLCLPMHASLTPGEVDRVINAVRDFFRVS